MSAHICLWINLLLVFHSFPIATPWRNDTILISQGSQKVELSQSDETISSSGDKTWDKTMRLRAGYCILADHTYYVTCRRRTPQIRIRFWWRHHGGGRRTWRTSQCRAREPTRRHCRGTRVRRRASLGLYWRDIRYTVERTTNGGFNVFAPFSGICIFVGLLRSNFTLKSLVAFTMKIKVKRDMFLN